MGSSPTRGSSFFFGTVTTFGVLCCFALFVCLTLLASFFLPSYMYMYLSLNMSIMYMYMYIHMSCTYTVHVHTHTCTLYTVHAHSFHTPYSLTPPSLVLFTLSLPLLSPSLPYPPWCVYMYQWKRPTQRPCTPWPDSTRLEHGSCTLTVCTIRCDQWTVYFKIVCTCIIVHRVL